MSLWGSICAALYDRTMAGAERGGLARHRESLLAGAAGRVLEIGGGTGANLPYYGSAVTELILLEPEDAMARRMEHKLREHRLPTRLVRAPAERLPLDDESVDCVVSTLVLCSVVDPARALAEARRVLRPNGRLLFMEHVRSDDPALARWQDRLHVPWGWIGHGCQCNRRTVDAIRAAGMALIDLRNDVVPKALPIVRPLVIGSAARS